MKYFVVFLSFLFSGSLFAVDIDQLFEAQEKSVKKSTSVESDVYKSTENSSRAVQNRVDEINEQRRRMYRAAESTAAPTSEDSPGGWKVVKSYEGGFSEFGLSQTRTIFVVRCGGGAEYKVYRDDRNKWGAIGLGGNNSAATLEEAASKKCD